MKTKHIALTLLASAALMLSACVNENDYGEIKLEKNELAFRMGAIPTRSAAETESLGTFEVGSVQTEDGNSFILEESVESLDAGLATRGTPAFTENVAALYSNKFSAVAPYEANTKLPDAEFEFDGTTWWTHHYAGMGDLFPEGDNAKTYQLFMRMPGDITKDKYGLTSAPTYNLDGSIEFDYRTPDTAEKQTDILFTSKTITKNEDEVLFYHVLTGVKFQNFFTNKDGANVSKTNITEVTISGLKNTGHCKVTPGPTTEGSSATVSVWDPNRLGVSLDEGKTVTTYTQAFSDTTNYTVTEGAETENYGLDKLLNKTASARNLNNPDGSLTFWFIPQDITKVAKKDSVVLTVKFDVIINGTKTHSDEVLTVNLSDVVAQGHREWKAGELHTFTLKPIAVGVEINDNITSYVKSDVKVKNTGNIYEYVRVNMVANWVGQLYKSGTGSSIVYESDKTILNGYTNNVWKDEAKKIYRDSVMVEAWNDKDGKTNYGVFKDLVPQSLANVPATNDSTKNYWVRYDKYYYYIKPIGPTETVTDQLFTSYEVGKSPDFYIPDKWGIRQKAGNVHLEMDLMVQAIPAPVDKDGNVIGNENGDGYIKAWVEALGLKDKDELLDLKVKQ